jgi:predicted dehydrogenase
MNALTPIKVGAIGIGALGQGMIERFSKHPRTELVAVCDLDREKVLTCSSRYNINGYTHHLDLLEKENLDLIYLSVPPKWHHDIAIDVLKAGKHILCEKPLANSLQEAKNMLMHAKESNVIHAINFPLNYMNNTKRFMQLLSNGYLGKLRRVDLIMEFPKWPRYWQQNNWINTREQGGFVFEVAGHFIQLIQRFFGPIKDVKRELELPENPSLPETGIIATMRLQDGTPIIFNGISGIAGLEEQRLSLTAYGTEGTLSLVDLIKLKAGKLGEAFHEIELEENDFWHELIDHLCDAIEGRESELYDFQVGYEVQQVLELLRGKDPQS